MMMGFDFVRYTVIYHAARIRIGLGGKGGLLAYAVADSIYHLSASGSGWCVMSRGQMAEFFGVDRSTIVRVIDKLIELQLVERYPKPKNRNDNRIRTSSRWYTETVIHRNDEKQPPPQVLHNATPGVANRNTQVLHNATPRCCITPHNKNTNKNTDNNKIPPTEENLLSASEQILSTLKSDLDPLQVSKKFMQVYTARGWMIREGVPVVDWFAQLQNFIDREISGKSKVSTGKKFPDKWDIKLGEYLKKNDFPKYQSYCAHLRDLGLKPVYKSYGQGQKKIIEWK